MEQQWTYENGYWPQIEAYIDMVKQIVESGFELSEYSLDKIDFAHSLAIEVLHDSPNMSSEDRKLLMKLIGDTEAVLDNFRRTG
jgi:hypothetical protein